MPFRLFAMCHHEDQHDPLPEGASVLAVRELGAIVSDASYVAEVPGDDVVARHHAVVDAAFRQGEIVPIPPGTIFRNEIALRRWVELHYGAISDALAYVADRVGARVEITGTDRAGAEVDSGTDLAAAAAEMMRTLRRRAVAGVPLRREHTTGMPLGAAFLVERSLWGEFEHEVERLQQSTTDVRLALSGPWPPYDFVRVDLGS